MFATKRLVLRSLLLLLAAGRAPRPGGFPALHDRLPARGVRGAARRPSTTRSGRAPLAVVPGRADARRVRALPAVERLLLPLRGRGPERVPPPRRHGPPRRRSFFPTATRTARRARGRCCRRRTPRRSRSSRGSTRSWASTCSRRRLATLRAARRRPPLHAARPRRKGSPRAATWRFGAIAELGSDPFDGSASREGRFAALTRERFPQVEMRDLIPDPRRPPPDQERRARSRCSAASTRLSGLALIEGMRSTRPGQYERELDGMAKFIYYRNGAQGEAYYSLIASGRNAW